MRQPTVQFISFGTQHSKAAWTGFARRSPIQQFLMGILFIIIAIPLFLLSLIILLGLAALALTGFLVAFISSRVRNLFGAPRSNDRLRENVRVIQTNDRG